MDEMQLLRNIDPVQGTQLDRFPAQSVFEELTAELSLVPPASPHGPGRTVLGAAPSHRWLRRSLFGSVMAAVAAAAVIFAVAVPSQGARRCRMARTQLRGNRPCPSARVWSLSRAPGLAPRPSVVSAS